MDSLRARQLYAEHKSAIAYIDVEKPDGQRSIGSAFHIGDGVFVTARHVIEGNRIIEVKITESVGVTTREYFLDVLKVDVSDDYIREYDEKFGQASEMPMLFRHYLSPLEIVEGPCFTDQPNLDVAAFRVREMHDAAGIVKLGVHWDDWVYQGLWNLSDAIVLGYPPIPMVNEPLLIAAKAEIHTFVVPRHVRSVHFVLSAIPRGGFSGGVAIQESGDALGVVTSAFVNADFPEQMGFFAVLSVEAIIHCLAQNRMYPDVQREYHESILKFDIGMIIEGFAKDR